MTAIRDRVNNSPELQEARSTKDLDVLAAGLNAQGLMEIQSRYITARTILAELEDGAEILAALDAAASSSSAIKYALSFLKQDSGLDVGNPATQAMIDQLTPTVLSTDQATHLKNMALQPIVVTRTQVQQDMFNDDGSEK